MVKIDFLGPMLALCLLKIKLYIPFGPATPFLEIYHDYVKCHFANAIPVPFIIMAKTQSLVKNTVVHLYNEILFENK